MNDLMNIAGHAAAQSDRWLFIATLLVFGVFAVGVMRYFVRQHERLMEDHRQAWDSYQASLARDGDGAKRGESKVDCVPRQQFTGHGGVPR